MDYRFRVKQSSVRACNGDFDNRFVPADDASASWCDMTGEPVEHAIYADDFPPGTVITVKTPDAPEDHSSDDSTGT